MLTLPCLSDRGRKVEHLQDNIQGLSIKLTLEQIKDIEGAPNSARSFIVLPAHVRADVHLQMPRYSSQDSLTT